MSWRSALQQRKSSVPQDAARLEKSWKKNVLETLIFEHRRYCSEKAIEELMTDAERDALRKEFGNNRRQPTAKRFLEGSKSSRNRSQPQHQSSRQCGHSDSTHMNAFLCTGWWRTKMSLLLSVAHGGLTISRPTMTSSLMSCNWRNLISAAATAFCEFPSHVDDDHQKQQQVKLLRHAVELHDDDRARFVLTQLFKKKKHDKKENTSTWSKCFHFVSKDHG